MPTTKKLATGPGPPQKGIETESDTESYLDTDVDTPSESESDSEPVRGSAKGNPIAGSTDKRRSRSPGRRNRSEKSSTPAPVIRTSTNRTYTTSERENPRTKTDWNDSDSTLTGSESDSEVESVANKNLNKKKKKPLTKPSYPPSPRKPKKASISKLTTEAFRERTRKLHESYVKRPSVCAGWCGDCNPCWKATWGWSGWKWLFRNLPYILAFSMMIAGAVCATTGPQTGLWVAEADGYKFGGLGWCDSEESQCVTGVLYTDVSAGSWPAIAVPAILLAFGVLAVLHLCLLLFNILFIRNSVQSCCSDPEAQQKKKKSKGAPRQRAVVWFERTMTIMSFLDSITALVLVIWVSQTNADGDIGYELAMFLLVSPLIWFFMAMCYRSRWAYNASDRKSSAARKKERKQGVSTYNDPDEHEVIVAKKKPGRRIAKY